MLKTGKPMPEPSRQELKSKKMKKTGGIIAVAILGLAFIMTNPSQTEVEQYIKNREGLISLVNVVERKNFMVCSLYAAEVSSLKQGLFETKHYMGVLGQVIELD
jgi:hypothetical protein